MRIKPNHAGRQADRMQAKPGNSAQSHRRPLPCHGRLKPPGPHTAAKSTVMSTERCQFKTPT